MIPRSDGWGDRLRSVPWWMLVLAGFGLAFAIKAVLTAVGVLR